MQSDHPIFIVGMPRSGTTLLSMLLNRHETVWISPETHFLEEFLPIILHFPKLRARNEKLAAALAQNPLDRNFLQRFKREILGKNFTFSEPELNDLYQRAPRLSARDFFQAILEADAAKHGKRRWGEKTPYHLFYLPALKTLFPPAKFIHIKRDPRAVSLSTRTAWPRSESPAMLASETCFSWQAHMRIGSAYPSLYPDDYVEITFEDLVQHTERTLRRVCGFLALDFDPSMLREGREVDPNFHLSVEPWKAKALEPPDASRAAAWLTEMSADERLWFDRLIGTVMKAHGFPTSQQVADGRITRLREQVLMFYWRGRRALNDKRRLIVDHLRG
ncbi:MAG: sulfotransferase [Thermaerobacter sp.]|nr:sulfotransferase [Thermaerobacter sp.]